MSCLSPFWQRRSKPVRFLLGVPVLLLSVLLAAYQGIAEAWPSLRSVVRDLANTPRLR
jgi:hypothetical protein